MGSAVQLLTNTMRAALVLVSLLAGVHSRGLKFGPIAEANHAAESTLGCDPDYGWSDGADGSGKCYMLIKNFDYSTCYSDGGVGGYGMSWFDAMECCYYNKGHLAEPQSADEQAKIEEYIQIADGGTLGLSAWWLGGNVCTRRGPGAGQAASLLVTRTGLRGILTTAMVWRIALPLTAQRTTSGWT